MKKLYLLLLGVFVFFVGFAQETEPQKTTITAGTIRMTATPGTASETARPLVFVDGVETDLESMVLEPENIQQIDILKDKTAISQYGENAKSGVILIKAKAGTQFYTVTDFINPEKKFNTTIRQIELNGHLLRDMKKILIDKKALLTSTISSDMKADEKNCEMLPNDTLVIKTKAGAAGSH